MTRSTRLIDLEEVAKLLGRRPATVRRDLRRNPEAVPPLLQLPGTRLLRWREADVWMWLDRIAARSVQSVEGGKR
jgi:predicted DNA-binding transcriptional regulator AlpA